MLLHYFIAAGDKVRFYEEKHFYRIT